MSHHRVTISSLYGSQLMQNVLHFDNFDGVTTPEDIANDVEFNWVDKVRSETANTLTYFNILVQNISSPNLAPFSKTINKPGQSFGETRFPTFACIVFKLLTARAGRHGRGRCYIPGVVLDHVSNFILSQGFMNTWNTNIITPIVARYGPNGASNLRLCVREEVPNGPPVLNPIVSLQIRQTLGVQRRRNIGVGV